MLRERKVGGGEPQIWDAVGLKLLREFPRTPIYFSPDSTKIVPYLGGSWLVYDTRSWGSPVSLQYGADQCPKPQSELKFRFSRKGDLILAWAPRSSVCVWDAQTGKLVNASPTTRWLYEVGFSKNDTYMTTNRTDEYGRRTNLVEVWTPGTVEAVYTHRSYAPSVSYDGTKVVSATVDKKAVIWDITTGKTLVELIGHQDAIRDVAFSSDDQRIITASDDQTARIWDARTGTQILELSEYGSPVTFASFVSQGRVAATIDLKRNVAVFRVVTPEEIEETLRLDFPARARNDGK